MATNTPPGNLECLDGDAMEYLRANADIFAKPGITDLTVPHGSREVWRAGYFFSTVWGDPESGPMPKTGGGNYAAGELPTWQDVDAWALDSEPDIPDPTDVPTNFTLSALPAPDPNPGNRLGWDNPAAASTNWDIYVEIDDGTPQFLANCNGPSNHQEAAHHGTLGVEYCYRIRYVNPSFPSYTSNWTTQLCRVADNP